MRKLFLLLILPVFMTATSISQEKVVKRVPVRQHPYYASNVMPALKELVAQRGTANVNHFYVDKVEVLKDGSHSVLVYWIENRALILWEPGRGHNRQGYPDPKFDLADSRRYWRINKDVVPTLKDVGGSSFLITRQDAQRWVLNCFRYGERYVVERETQSNNSFNRTRNELVFHHLG